MTPKKQSEREKSNEDFYMCLLLELRENLLFHGLRL